MNKKASMLLRLWPFMKKRAWLLLLCCVLVLVINFSELAKPYILEIVIDRYLVTGKADAGLDSVWAMAPGLLPLRADRLRHQHL